MQLICMAILSAEKMQKQRFKELWAVSLVNNCGVKPLVELLKVLVNNNRDKNKTMVISFRVLRYCMNL